MNHTKQALTLDAQGNVILGFGTAYQNSVKEDVFIQIQINTIKKMVIIRIYSYCDNNSRVHLNTMLV